MQVKIKLFVFVTLCVALCHARQFRSRTNPTTNAEECFAEEKIYDAYTKKCYRLLTKGPCTNGHWFVLEKPKDSRNSPIRIAAECVKEKCKDGEYYWSDTKTCVKGQDESKICKDPAAEELEYNVFGEGECVCTTEPPRARLHNDKDNPCHILYSQGPCRPGQVLGFRSSDADEPTCIQDRCYEESQYRKRTRTLSPDTMLVPWRDNKCYELGTQGPCLAGETFKVHSRYLVPKCVLLTNAIFDLQQNCFPDESGKCQREIISEGDKYKRDIIRALRANRRRRNSDRMKNLRVQRTEEESIAWRWP